MQLAMPIVSVLGTIGNLLTIGLMLQPAIRKLPVSRLLLGMSIGDTLVEVSQIATVITVFGYPRGGKFLRHEAWPIFEAAMTLFSWGHMQSNWAMVFVAAERLCAVSAPIWYKVMHCLYCHRARGEMLKQVHFQTLLRT